MGERSGRRVPRPCPVHLRAHGHREAPPHREDLRLLNHGSVRSDGTANTDSDRETGRAGHCACGQGHTRVLQLQYAEARPRAAPPPMPAEQLWPVVTHTLLVVRRHVAGSEDVEDAQAARCVAWHARPDLIRSPTRCSW
jgi:hypothetical protein